MSAKVVSLNGAEIIRPGADPDVVRALEDWLERARSGEIVGVAVVGFYRDNASGSQHAGLLSRSMVGQCFSLMQRITARLEDLNK